MALLHRANLNLSFLIKNPCLKGPSLVNQLLNHGKSVHNVSNEFTNNVFHHKDSLVDERSKKKVPQKHVSFKEMLDTRRKQAERSIIVEVNSMKSIENLHKECSMFGKILSMHHYRANRENDFVLVEFENQTAVENITSEAAFSNVSPCIPVPSSMMKFKPIQTSQKPESMRSFLSAENGIEKPTLNNILSNLKTQDSVMNQMVLLHQMLKLNDLGIRLRFHTAQQLEKCFHGFFTNAVVCPFGSTVNGFGKTDCDLDAVLILNDKPVQNRHNQFIFHAKPFKSDHKLQVRELMEIIATSMQHLIPGIQNVRKILRATVPIIKFNQKFTNIECDLSISNSSAIYMSELLYIYGEMDARVKPLVFTIRLWAHVQFLTNNSPGPWITNFSLTILVLFYLQRVGILPSVDALKSLANDSDVQYTMNGVDCTFLRDINIIESQFKPIQISTSLQDLLYDFFDFYSKFDYKTKGISIRAGTTVAKKNESPLYICNPLETQLNVSKNIQSSELLRLTSIMRQTCRTLENSLKNPRDMWGILSIVKTNLSNPQIQTNSIDVHDIFENSKITSPFSKANNSQSQAYRQNQKKNRLIRR